MTTYEEGKSQLDELIAGLSKVVRPIVLVIERAPATTKDHYADYMNAIDRLVGVMPASERSAKMYLAVGLALQRAGGNKDGIHSALRVMGHM